LSTGISWLGRPIVGWWRKCVHWIARAGLDPSSVSLLSSHRLVTASRALDNTDCELRMWLRGRAVLSPRPTNGQSILLTDRSVDGRGLLAWPSRQVPRWRPLSPSGSCALYDNGGMLAGGGYHAPLGGVVRWSVTAWSQTPRLPRRDRWAVFAWPLVTESIGRLNWLIETHSVHWRFVV